MNDEQFYQAFRNVPVGRMTPEQILRWEEVLARRIEATRRQELLNIGRGIVAPAIRNVIVAQLRRAGITEATAEVIQARARAIREDIERRTGTIGPRIINRPPIREGGGTPGVAGDTFVYRRIVAFRRTESRRRNQLRFATIIVASPVPLRGAALERRFAAEISDFRRLIHYAGPMWYATGEEYELPEDYEEPYDYEDFDVFEVPEDVYEDYAAECEGA